MRVYPISIKDEKKEIIEQRIAVDVEDLFDMMMALEMVNYNIFDNWQNLKGRIMEVLTASVSAAAPAQEGEAKE
jgi:hypothetical protein